MCSVDASNERLPIRGLSVPSRMLKMRDVESEFPIAESIPTLSPQIRAVKKKMEKNRFPGK